MKKIAVIFSDGTEELEALTPVDVLRRAGAQCDIISISGNAPVGSHNIKVFADKVVEAVDFCDYDAIVLPGGMPGATYISKNQKVISAIKDFMSKNKLVCAICASPAVVLASNGILGNISATCYPAPDFINMIENYTGEDVTVCGNVITANGPKSAIKFSLQICESLGIVPKF
jgi:4-methyl-5(b-hydroxyethyl)-thiazole monophosphate biosynthesis